MEMTSRDGHVNSLMSTATVAKASFPMHVMSATGDMQDRKIDWAFYRPINILTAERRCVYINSYTLTHHWTPNILYN